jgi:hypothetical protein
LGGGWIYDNRLPWHLAIYSINGWILMAG